MTLPQALKIKKRRNDIRKNIDFDSYDDDDIFAAVDEEIRDTAGTDVYDDPVPKIRQGPWLGPSIPRSYQVMDFDDASDEKMELPSAQDNVRFLERPVDISGPTTGDMAFILKAPSVIAAEKWHRRPVPVFEIPPKIFSSDAFHSLSTKEQPPIDFFKLVPAEIRNAIYSCLLESPTPLRLITVVGRSSYPFLASGEGDPFDVDGPRELKRLAILQVNKQVTEEVLPILYGKNTFDFDKASTMVAFLKKIGSNVQDLDKLEISGKAPWDIDTSMPRFANLDLATNLTSLTIDHRDLYAHALSAGGKISVRDLAGQLQKFLHSWGDARGDKSKAKSVLDVVEVIEFPTCECGERLADCKYEDCEKRQKKVDGAHLGKLSKGLRDAIAEKLGIEG